MYLFVCFGHLIGTKKNVNLMLNIPRANSSKTTRIAIRHPLPFDCGCKDGVDPARAHTSTEVGMTSIPDPLVRHTIFVSEPGDKFKVMLPRIFTPIRPNPIICCPGVNISRVAPPFLIVVVFTPST